MNKRVLPGIVLLAIGAYFGFVVALANFNGITSLGFGIPTGLQATCEGPDGEERQCSGADAPNANPDPSGFQADWRRKSPCMTGTPLTNQASGNWPPSAFSRSASAPPARSTFAPSGG